MTMKTSPDEHFICGNVQFPNRGQKKSFYTFVTVGKLSYAEKNMGIACFFEPYGDVELGCFGISTELKLFSVTSAERVTIVEISSSMTSRKVH